MGKSIVTKEQMGALINPEFSGLDLDEAKTYPPSINVLQSDKQYKSFPDVKKSELIDRHGEVFVRSKEGNSLKDLKTELEGTIVGIQKGYEVYRENEDRTRSFVDAGRGYYPKDEKESREENEGVEILNMVKVVICFADSKEEVEEIISDGGNPFAILPIKKASFGEWFDAEKQMNTLALASDIYQHRGANKLLASVFRIKITGKQVEGNAFSYFVPGLEISLNKPDTAYALASFVTQFKDIDLFAGRTLDKVINEPKEEPAMLEEGTIEEAFGEDPRDDEDLIEDILG